MREPPRTAASPPSPRSVCGRRVLRLLPTGAILLLAACVGAGSSGEDGDAGGRDTARAAPEKEVILPEGSSPSPLYSPVVRHGNTLYLSGAIGFDPETGELAEGVGPQTRLIMETIRERLAAAGAGMEDLLKCTVFLADIDDYGAVNDVYRTFFEGAPPARSAVAVDGLVLDAGVEIECVAAAPR